MAKQKQMIIALGVIALLLVVIIAVVAFSAPTGSVSKDAGGETTATPATGSMGTDGSAMGASGQEVPFDEASAVALPKDTSPRQWVEAYYKACDDGKWDVAHAHLPATKQQVTTADALKKQLEGYGIVGYKIAGEQENESGDTVKVSASQETANYGTFTSIWTFIKGSDGQWLLKNKAVATMN